MRRTRPAFTFAHTNSSLILAPVLVGLLLAATGCTSIHRVVAPSGGQGERPSDAYGYSRVTEKVAGKTITVLLRDGREMELKNLYVGPDFTTGTRPQGGERTFPTSIVKKVELTNRGRGFLEGFGVGAGTAFGSAVLAGFASDGAFGASVMVLVAGAPIAFVGGLAGGVIGGIAGHQRAYLFPDSSPGSNSTEGTLNARQDRGASHKRP
jgi:hypothetical protein